jgi:hypothetical protein
MKRLGFRENKYRFPDGGMEFCVACMTCSICNRIDPKEAGAMLGMQPFCHAHYERYKDILQLTDTTEWPEENPTRSIIFCVGNTVLF